jgi:hypothetical protein
MKKTLVLLTVFLLALSVMGQRINVKQGNVTYQFAASRTGEMTYAEGKTVTIMGKTFALTDIDAMTFGGTSVKDNTVSVAYNGASATVTIAGNVAQYVDATVSGAHVTINQTNTADVDGDEITYVLSGSTDDGSLTLNGSYKCTLSLAGLTLANPTGTAINISNKKRIQVSVKKDTENVLADGANGQQKACFYSKGQLQLQGNGTLTVTGNTAHAIKSGDYIEVKNLTLSIPSAVKDGISCNKYFLMKSGSVTILGVGDDGIQTDLETDDATTAETEGHEEENSGNIYVEGGTLTVTIPAAAAGGKCLKAEGLARIDGGALSLTASGKVDTSDSTDPSFTAGVKGTNVAVNGGTIDINVTGAAGRGISADETITTNDGTLTINNSGAPTTISSDVKGAKGLKALHMALNGGTITINMSGNASKAIRCGDGTQSSSGGGGGGWRPGGGGPGGGGGGGSTWTNVTGTYTQGKSDGTGPTLTISQTGATYSSSSAKAIKAICAVTIYGGETDVYTKSSGGEGLESKTSIDIQGGKHYFKCYDDCINSVGKIFFNGGVTVCWSNGNDAVDSNAGTTGAITIGNGVVFAYTTKGAPEEGFDCDNNSYIQITGTGIGISAGASQGGGGGWGGGSSGNTISNAKQGYAFVTSSISYQANRYYTLADASGNNLVTYSFPASCSSTLALFTATGMVKGSSYNVKYSTTAPTDATTVWHGLYLGSTHQGTTSVTSFTAK